MTYRLAASAPRTTKAYRLNATADGKRFRARLLEPGLVSYEDVGFGVALLRKNTIDRCIGSFVGCPVVVRHKKANKENKAAVGHGEIERVEYDAADGWWYGVGSVDTPEAARAIAEWGRGSVAYMQDETGAGGKHHGIRYNEEILSFSGEHLAIEPRPRYEGATIRLNAVKPQQNQKTMSLIKWVKKKIASRENAGGSNPPATETPEAKLARENAESAARENAAEEITGETEFEVPTPDGKSTNKITLNALIEAHNERENGVAPESEIDVDGKPVALSSLIDSHRKLNAAPVETPEAKLARENAEKAAANPEKKPKNYKVLLNANRAGDSLPAGAGGSPDSINDRIARGAERYGAKTAGKN